MDNQPTHEIDSEGNKRWYLNGKLHRIDGPAIEFMGELEWWINGDEYDFEDFLKKIEDEELKLDLVLKYG